MDEATTSSNAEEFDFEVDVDHLMLDVIKRQTIDLYKPLEEYPLGRLICDGGTDLLGRQGGDHREWRVGDS